VSDQIGYAPAAAGMAALLKFLAELDADAPTRGAVNTLTLQGQAQYLIVEQPAPSPAAQVLPDEQFPERLFRLEAADATELSGAIDRYTTAGNGAPQELAAFSPSPGARLVVVTPDRHTLAASLALARRGLESPSARPVLEKQGIFIGDRRNSPPRIAFAFAGQGSQHAGMLRTLIEASPVAAAQLESINATLRELGLPTFKQLAWDEPDKLGRELFETQLSVLLADVLMFRVLAAEGIRPDVITAHSFGEYAALVASGAWGLEQAIETTGARCRAITECGVSGGMLATTAPVDDLEQLLAERDVAEEVFLANANSPAQTVVAGRNEALRTFAEYLRSRGHETKELPVPAPFHTPLMDPVRAPLQSVLDNVTFRPPVMPFLSSVTNRYTSDPLDLRDNLVEQLVRPVRYVDLVRRLVADGIDVIVEVGPRDVLTKLHRAITGDGQIGVIATDDPRHAGTRQLLYVQALLECRGALHAGDQPTQRPVANNHGRGSPPARTARSGPIIHFDATAKRRERNRRAAHATEMEPARSEAQRRNGAPTDAAPDDELAGFLVRFVCEQTGYPPEVVDLDAELEADLGIDSIKKAQLLGELREHFPLRPAAHLSLDDFPTLRHILEFIRASQAESGGGTSPSEPALLVGATGTDLMTSVLGRPPLAAVARANRLAESSPAIDREAAAALNLRRFSGTPYDLGRQHGEAEGDAIRNVMHKYVELLGGRLFEMRPLQSALDQREAYFGVDGLEELRGIAEAVDVPLEHMLSFNYGLSMEFLPGCTQFAVTARRNGDTGLIHAVNEDWMLALALPGTLQRMAQVRFPAGAIPFLTFSTCGELAGQNGVNARGLAVSSTLLLDRLRRDEAPPGRVHPALVKSVLERAATIDAALAIIRELPRTGAWSLCLSQSDADRLCYVEYDAESVDVRWSDDVVESTNHCLLQAALGETPAQSCQRLDRLHELLHGENGAAPRVTLAQAQAILRDRYDRSLGRVTTHPTKATIRRPYTQASIVMRPAAGEVWVTADTRPDQPADRFHRLDLGELFRAAPEDNGAAGNPAASAITDSDPALCRAIPDRIMNRFVLRMMDAPLPESASGSQPLTGRVLLLGDNPTAQALRSSLEYAGAEVLPLPVSDAASAVERLEQIWAEGPVPTLFLATARDAACGLDETAWSQRRERGVLLPYFVCQKWVQLATRPGSSFAPRLIALTGMGGDFGLSGRSPAVEGGALAGLLKAVRHEFDQITAKVIDAPLEDPPQLVARCVLAELAGGAPDVEIACVCGRRRVVTPVPRLVAASAADTRFLEETRFLDTPPPHGTWVVTGGGRGVTATVARELARRYGLKLHLIGSSPLPDLPAAWRDLTADARRHLRTQIAQEARASGRDPAPAWREIERGLELDANLRVFAADGIFVTYHACDVADRDRLAAVLESVRAADGPIHGVIHGAGFEAACRFDKKTRAAVSATLAAKVDGALHLAELTRDDPLEFFVGFGSISGRFGGHGQTDYSMSSDLLAKLLSRMRRERPACRAVAVHWPAWGEVGMAMRPESKLALEIAGHKFMPPPEGAAHLADELGAGAPEGEVLLYDWPAPRGPRRASPWTAAEAQAFWRRAPSIAAAPLIDGLAHLAEGRRLSAELCLDPVRDPFLAQHRHETTPILPIVVALEALAEGVHLLLPDADASMLCDVSIHDGMRFQTPDAERARVDVLLQDDGRLRCELRSDFRNRRGAVADPSRRYVSAIAEIDQAAPKPAVPWAEPPVPWRAMAYDSEEAKQVQRMIWHGPVFQCLRDFCVADKRLWGRIVAPPPSALRPGTHAAAWRLPAAVLDACLQACSTLTYVCGGKYHLPHTIGRLHLGRAPATGESCIVLVQFREERDERTHFDFTLYGEDRRVILDAVDYRAAIISGRKGPS
jgi:malonyl CoA-acyl carrier protein transacylase